MFISEEFRCGYRSSYKTITSYSSIKGYDVKYRICIWGDTSFSIFVQL